jgi:hypothetical protein
VLKHSSASPLDVVDEAEGGGGAVGAEAGGFEVVPDDAEYREIIKRELISWKKACARGSSFVSSRRCLLSY